MHRRYFYTSKTMLKFVILFISFTLYCTKTCHAFDLDMTVDDDIRKNYNPSQLIKDTKTENFGDSDKLPELPQNLIIDSPKESNIKSVTNVVQNNAYLTKIPRGTVLDVISSGNISDWQTKGTVVSFKTQNNIVKRKFSIPAGTVFKGEIIESHQPQISCNGGLVVVRIKSMYYKGEYIPINAYVTKADNKFIFLNNIKGERTYLKTMWKKGNWGRNLFNKMFSMTVNLSESSSTVLFSPFPLAYGTVCLGANTLISPITAFFEKGKHVSIKSGSKFRIKLLDEAFID